MNSSPKQSVRQWPLYLLVCTCLVLPMVACKEPDRSIDPTVLAPVDLSGRDFSHINFVDLDLSGKNFQEAKFVNAKFYDVSFRDADLRRADFTAVRGDDLDFTGADLRGAIFDNFCIYNANIVWTDAQLDERWAEIIALLTQGFYPGQDLRGYDLSQVCLHYYDLTGVNLAGGKLAGANLTLTNFTAANLKGVDFSSARVHGADFSRADLTGAIGVTIYDASSESPIVVLCDTRLPTGEISDDRMERCGYNDP